MLSFSNLPYAYNALEPHIDATTMEIHHSRHHKTYFDKFCDAIKGTAYENKSLQEVFADAKNLSPAIRNNGGGFYNHNFFWACMSPNGKRQPSGALADAINAAFGSYDELKNQINQAGITRFGSGFAWLVQNKEGKLQIGSTPYQDNPLMSDAPIQGTPLMAIDVWEHAYYLKYQNKRPDYLNAFWNVVDWTPAEAAFK